MQQQRFDEANRKVKAAADAAAEAAPAPSRKRKAGENPDSYTARLARIHEGKGGSDRHPLRDGAGTASCSLGKSRQARG